VQVFRSGAGNGFDLHFSRIDAFFEYMLFFSGIQVREAYTGGFFCFGFMWDFFGILNC